MSALTLCPCSLAMPHSATTSQTMTAVSLLPDTSRSPARSQARQLTAVLCPVKVTSTSRVPVSHSLHNISFISMQIFSAGIPISIL